MVVCVKVRKTVCKSTKERVQKYERPLLCVKVRIGVDIASITHYCV